MRKTAKPIVAVEIGRFLRFGVTGVINTGVDFGVFFILAHLLGVSIYVSQFLAYSTATINSYIINRRWTFGRKGPFAGGEFARFVAVNVCSLGLSLILLRLFHGHLHMQKMTAKVITACFTIPVNFLGSRLWAFGPRTE